MVRLGAAVTIVAPLPGALLYYGVGIEWLDSLAFLLFCAQILACFYLLLLTVRGALRAAGSTRYAYIAGVFGSLLVGASCAALSIGSLMLLWVQ